MKGKEKNIFIGMVVVALLLVAGAYKFFYSEDMDKIKQVESEIATKQARLNELNEKNQNRPMYEAGISNSKDIIDTILALYGPGNKPEKTIMLVVDMCKKTGVTISDITFQGDKMLYSVEPSSENPAGIQIYQTGMAINISAGYTQFKKLMDYINSYPERMNAENFNMSFNGESGRLNVGMNVNMYSVKDKNHEYVDPVIEDIDIGTTNIFRANEPTPEEESEEGAEGDEDAQLAEGTASTQNNTVTE